MTVGTPRTHKRKRTALRKRLRDEGWPEPLIERAVERLRQRQDAARRAHINPVDFEDHIDIWWDEHRLDDRGYKPNPGDALARGTARVTNTTLRASRRAKATTKHEHDRQEKATP